MVLGPKNEPFYGQSYRYIVFFGDIGDGSARCQEPGAASSRGDRPEDRQAHLPEGLKIDDTSLAHLKEIRFRIEKVLKANLNANEP